MNERSAWDYGPTDQQYEVARAAMQLFFPPGQVTELRALAVSTADFRRPHVVSGYFDDVDALATAAVSISPFAKGVYTVMNEVNPALIARAVNRIRPVNNEPLTGDNDILSRRWLLIDLDAVRPAGISATDVEHEAAIHRAEEIRCYLRQIGFPEPVYADSGNGAHLDYLVNLPVKDNGLVASVLSALAGRFDDSAVKVDSTVHNPARIWKSIGTMARKGDSTPERPHRVARIIESPVKLTAVPNELLERVAGMATDSVSQPTRSRGPLAFRLTQFGSFDLAKWIKDHDLDVEGPRDWQGGQRWIFRACPWNDAHRDRSAFIVQFANGAIAAGCHHDGCQDKNWHSLRDEVEPGWREPQLAYVPVPDGAPAAVRRAYRRIARGIQ